MCDIGKETKLREVTVYKAVRKWTTADGLTYVSPFANAPISPGRMTKDDTYADNIEDGLYNTHMIGRVSGFADPGPAWELCRGRDRIVLKIVLGSTDDMPILEGTARGISLNIPDRRVTYAGPVVLRMEEFKRRI